MTQHYGMRQLAFRKSWSYTLIFLGLNLFISCWPPVSILEVIPTLFIGIFTLYYFSNMLKYHKWHAIKWGTLGIGISVLIASIVFTISIHHPTAVQGTMFDELQWAEQIHTYPETKFAMIMCNVVGLCLAIIFGMLGLHGGLFKATAGIFLGIGLGFGSGSTFLLQHIQHGYSFSSGCIGGLLLAIQSVIWIAFMSSIVAALLACVDRFSRGYQIIMSYERDDIE